MIHAEALAEVARVLDPLSPDRFFGEVLGKQVATLEGDADHPRAALLGRDPRETLLAAHTALIGRFGIHTDGVSGPPPSKDGITDAAGFAALIAEHHARGYTVHLGDVAALSPPLTPNTLLAHADCATALTPDARDLALAGRLLESGYLRVAEAGSDRRTRVPGSAGSTESAASS